VVRSKAGFINLLSQKKQTPLKGLWGSAPLKVAGGYQPSPPGGRRLINLRLSNWGPPLC